MLFYAFWETCVIAYIGITRVLPWLVRVVSRPFKLSLLHITTLFKGWIPVANQMAATWLLEGIAEGKYPQNPPDRIKNGLLMNAHMTIGLGAFINCFTAFYILMHLIYG
jgi:hypothetical protein